MRGTPGHDPRSASPRRRRAAAGVVALLAVAAVLAMVVLGRGGEDVPVGRVAAPALGPPLTAAVDRAVTTLERVHRAELAARRRAELRRLRDTRTVPGALRRAWLAGVLGRAAYLEHRDDLAAARRAAAQLTGTPGAEQRAALGIVEAMAGAGALTSARVRLAFLQLRRNTAFWARGTVPAPQATIPWGTDAATMRYFPGKGLVVHPLAGWGRVNALAGACRQAPGRCPRARLRHALDRLLALGSRTRGYLAWESLFPWGRGAPGWVSGMVQGTAIQALARGHAVLGDRAYATAARGALGAFERRPPAGVAVDGHFLMYSFDPGLRIFNGFVQALNGIRDLQVLDGSRRAAAAFRRGEAEARRELPRADTGAWSRYRLGGEESTLHYHRLVTGFLGGLCDRTERATWCAARDRFALYARQPTRMRLHAPRRPRADAAMAIGLSLSKVSDVRVTIDGPGDDDVRRTLRLARGAYRLPWRPARKGEHRIRILAQGPSGPPGRVDVQLRVLRSRAEVLAERRQAQRERERRREREREKG